MAKNKGGMQNEDARFAAVHRDPRFSRFPRKHTSVTIDERFKGVLDDPDFQVKSTVNKRGKKVTKKTNNDDMRRFYHLEDMEGDVMQGGAKESKEARTKKGKALERRSNSQEQVQVVDAQPLSADADDDSAPAEVTIKKSAKEVDQLVQDRTKRAAAAPVPVRTTPSKKQFESESEEDEVVGADEAASEDADMAVESSDDAGDASGSEDGQEGDHEDVSEDNSRSDGSIADEAKKRYQRMRGIGSDVESSSEDDDEGLDEPGNAALTIGGEEEVELDPAEWGVGAAAGNPDADDTLIMMEDATKRLAVVDLDWQKMRAVDILAVLQSFVSKGSSLLKVTVYVSDYGREQMAREREAGPQGLRSEKNAEDSDEEVEISDAHAQERVRMYERSKLRWYFAIAEFQTVAGASVVYDECDGIEFEESSARFDLRFVPDSEDFSGRQVRDEAVEVPAGYEAPMFKSKALQHTKPTLTWDEDDDTRKKALHRKLGADELKEEDFAAYLASESEEEADDDQRDAEAIRKRYAALVDDSVVAKVARRQKNGVKSWLGDGEDEQGGAAGSAGAKQEMEVTFASGLENLGKRILDKKAVHKARAGQTVFEQYLQRKKDKKAAQRASGRVNVDSDSDDDMGGGSESAGDSPVAGSGDEFFNDDGKAAEKSSKDAGFDDPFFKDDANFDDDAQSDDDADAGKPTATRKKKEPKGATTAESRELERQRRAELELLMMDDAKLAAAKDGIHVAGVSKSSGGDDAKKRLSRKQMMASKKDQRKRAKDRRDSDDDEEFDADIDDPRFKALTHPEFAIDSTDPHLNRIKNPNKLISQISERRKRLRPNDDPNVKRVADATAPTLQGKSDLAALVGSLKRKGHKHRPANL